MPTYKVETFNEALPLLASELLQNGIPQPCRDNAAGSSSVRFEGPLLLEVTKPDHHNIWLKERNWSSTLAYSEALWIMLGWNDLDDLTGRYVKNLYNFSDDGKYWRGGYGPRIRSFTASREQYEVSEHTLVTESHVDQLKYVFEELSSNPYSRQATITISDPSKDIFDSKGNRLVTKDYPCTRELVFERNPRTGGLNLSVVMRSNDALWGASAVNWFNFSMIQEILARMLGWPVGVYYHFATNFHYYETSREVLRRIATYDPEKLQLAEPKREYIPYKAFGMKRLTEVLDLIRKVENYSFNEDFDNAIRAQRMLNRMDHDTYGFFADWARVLLRHNTKGKSVRKEPKIRDLFEYLDPYMKETLK